MNRRQKLQKEKELYYRNSTVIFLLAMILVFLIVGSTVSLAWLSKNIKGKEAGMKMNLEPSSLTGFRAQYTEEVTEYFLLGSDGELVDFNTVSNFIPGSSFTFGLGVKNDSNRSVTVDSLKIASPSVWHGADSEYKDSLSGYDEIPVQMIDEKEVITYEYFGNDLQVSLIDYNTYTVNGVSGSKVNLTLKSDKTAEVSTADLLNYPADAPTEKSLISGLNLTIAPGEAVVFTLEVDFIDSREDQSAFINFGADDTIACCTRKFIVGTID